MEISVRSTDLLAEVICRPKGTKVVVVDENTGTKYDVVNTEFEPGDNVLDTEHQLVLYIREQA